MKLILIALLSLSGSFAFAGNSGADPVVASLRARFSKAFVPSDKQLNLEGSWECRYYSTKKDVIFQEASDLKLDGFDGLYLINKGYYTEETFVRTSRGLVKTNQDGKATYTKVLRVDDKGYLLTENSFTTSDKRAFQDNAALFEKSLSIEGNLVYLYGVCVKKPAPSAIHY